MADTRKITISLANKTLELLEQLANEKGIKKSAIVSLALAEYYESQKVSK